MLNKQLPKIKKRTPWKSHEDKLLKQFVKQYQNERLGWKKISRSLKQQGYDRSTKACRERFFNYLDNSYNKGELSHQELDKLFELIKIHGNKWTQIAQELNHRTDQVIKNKFYAHIKKVFRRLLKATFQKSTSSTITAKIQPLLISSIFCDDNDNSPLKFINLREDMKDLFKNLIKQNKTIQLGEEISVETREDVKLITQYLEKENQLYLQKKSLRRVNKLKIKSKNCVSKFKILLNEFQEKGILKKIQNKKPIFVLKSKNFDYLQISFQKSFEVGQYQFSQDKIMENAFIFSQNQIISNIPFYCHQPFNKIESNHHEISQFEIPDTYNYPNPWNI